MRAISCVAEVEFDWRVSAMDVGMCGIYGGIIATVVDTGVMLLERLYKEGSSLFPFIKTKLKDKALHEL